MLYMLIKVGLSHPEPVLEGDRFQVTVLTMNDVPVGQFSRCTKAQEGPRWKALQLIVRPRCIPRSTKDIKPQVTQTISNKYSWTCGKRISQIFFSFEVYQWCEASQEIFWRVLYKDFMLGTELLRKACRPNFRSFRLHLGIHPSNPSWFHWGLNVLYGNLIDVLWWREVKHCW